MVCAIVCDGAGSAPNGGEGASIITRLMTTALRDHFRHQTRLPDDERIWSWIDQARDALSEAAAKRETTRRAFASTLVVAIITPTEALTVHAGDGAIVARDEAGLWRALSWPENGEYASTTYFLTDDPSPRVRLARWPETFDALAVFSDGIEDLALDQKAMMAHEPFFQGMIRPLDGLTAGGKDRNLSTALNGFLKSARVCERTDDDKTLILASQR